MTDNPFSHLDAEDNPAMVNVADKSVTKRSATAQAKVILPGEVISLLKDQEIQTKKGPVLQTAILAGIMGAKKTSELIPLCHPLGLENCQVKIHFKEDLLIIHCTATLTAKTGVEMEALTGASIAALTVYDMCKAFSHEIIIKEIKLLAKSGGKRDFDHR